MAGTSKVCCLCGRTGREIRVSMEDTIPNWVRNYIATNPPFTLFLDGVPVSAPTPTPRRFRVPICRECNGWLNDEFENPAIDLMKELFDGWMRPLPVEEQILAGRWIGKTCLMKELWHRDRTQFPAQTYREFRATGQLPASLLIWLGVIDAAPSTPELAPPLKKTDLRNSGCKTGILQIKRLGMQFVHCHLREVGTIENRAEASLPSDPDTPRRTRGRGNAPTARHDSEHVCSGGDAVHNVATRSGTSSPPPKGASDA
jgi:hypothetical protein